VASSEKYGNADRFFFNTGDVRLSGLDFGNADATDMVLLHGIRDISWSMTSIVEEFRQDYHIVVPDLRGHGDSDNPSVYTMSHFIADLRSLIVNRELENPVIIAHSLGGHIAAQYAALFPDEVSALALVDGMGPPRFDLSESDQQTMDRERITMLLQDASQLRVMRDIDEAHQRMVRNNPRLNENTARMLAEKGTHALDDGGVIWKWDAAAHQVWGTFSSDENEARLKWIQCPVLLITAEHSMAYWGQMREHLRDLQAHHDAEVERRRQIFKNARHVSIEGAGHMIHYDQPEQLNIQLREFISSL
jgi:pimeloyl-ACP methyl ester carboxylesterase